MNATEEKQYSASDLEERGLSTKAVTAEDITGQVSKLFLGRGSVNKKK